MSHKKATSKKVCAFAHTLFLVSTHILSFLWAILTRFWTKVYTTHTKHTKFITYKRTNMHASTHMRTYINASIHTSNECTNSILHTYKFYATKCLRREAYWFETQSCFVCVCVFVRVCVCACVCQRTKDLHKHVLQMCCRWVRLSFLAQGQRNWAEFAGAMLIWAGVFRVLLASVAEIRTGHYQNQTQQTARSAWLRTPWN